MFHLENIPRESGIVMKMDKNYFIILFHLIDKEWDYLLTPW